MKTVQRASDRAVVRGARARLPRAGVAVCGAGVILAVCCGPAGHVGAARAVAAAMEAECYGDLARKADIMFSPRWQQAIAEFGGWLTTQTIYPPAEVRRIKNQFNDRVAGMSSYEIEYLLDSLSAKLDLLGTPEAQDAKAWLGEYLFAMSDARRAAELRTIPNLLDMNAAQLWQEIQRIDRLRATMQQRQQGVEARQEALVKRAAATRQSTAAASQAAAARARSAPAHSPYRQGGGSLPFADAKRQGPMVNVGMLLPFLLF
jgi:hypothetical protein